MSLAKLIRLRREEGFTLIESLVVCLSLVVVVGAILGLVDLAESLAPNDRERAHAVRDGETGMSRMVRELRQAYDVTVTDWQVDAKIVLNGVDTTVRFKCDTPSGAYKKCVRQVIGGGTPVAELLVDRVANAAARPVFAATTRAGETAPSYVRAVVELPARGERTTGPGDYRVVLEDGFYLRNVDALR